MTVFLKLLANSLISTVTTFFVWSSVIYWAYLETGSVLATSIIGGLYLVIVAVSGLWFGALVDRVRKKTSMLISSTGTLLFFVLALVVLRSSPPEAFTTIASGRFWAVILILLLGVIAGNIRSIAMPTMVTFLVPEDRRDRANGMMGMVFGASFALSNVAAGFGLGFFGMSWVLITGIVLTAATIVHLVTIAIVEPARPTLSPDAEKKRTSFDFKGTVAVVRSIPGLFSLIFFSMFNNFLGGVFISLMDAYGLSLVSVEVWGTLWGVLSLGFIAGGLIIAKRGIGKDPVRTLFSVNIFMWVLCGLMTIQPSISLLAACILAYLVTAPFIEAAEQTIIQKVVTPERQGRVFGFAQSIEQSASPVTAFLVGPLAQFFFIPFMTTGAGVELIGGWYGTGAGRGIGLVFTLAGVLGLAVTLMARRSRAFTLLAEAYRAAPAHTVAPKEEV